MKAKPQRLPAASVGQKEPGLIDCDPERIDDLVCAMFFEKGLSPTEITDTLRKELPTFSRERPYRIIQDAIKHRLVVYESPRRQRLAARFQRDLQKAERPVTSVDIAFDLRSVARSGAVRLFRTSLAIANQREDGMVTIGWAPGFLMSLVAREFAIILQESEIGGIRKLRFRTVLESWDQYRPWLHPNSFFSFFNVDGILNTIECEFEAMYGPLAVTDDVLAALSQINPSLKAGVDAEPPDCVITSVGDWGTESNMFKQFCDVTQQCDPKLQKSLIGDFLGIPMTANGPVDIKSMKVRPFTLMSVAKIRQMITDKKSVILVDGKRSAESRTRAHVITVVIRENLVSDLVLDFATFKELNEQLGLK